MGFRNRVLRTIPLFLCFLALATLPVKGAPRAVRADAKQFPSAEQLEARAIEDEGKYFHVQVYLSGPRYQSSRPSWIGFQKGGEGYVVQKAEEAASLCIKNGQLISSSGQYVHLEFSKGYATFKCDNMPQKSDVYYNHNGDYLEILGSSMTYGQGEGVCCIGDDGGLYVQGQGATPFQCRQVDLRPNSELPESQLLQGKSLNIRRAVPSTVTIPRQKTKMTIPGRPR
nr:hypothetical protein LTR18_011117 [Exophiala xenobiotica]